jgi:hypothetical protein
METDAGPLWKRLAWMVAIWAGSVAALGVVAMLIRWWLKG